MKLPNRRLGRFLIGHNVFESNVEKVQRILESVVVLRVKDRYDLDAMEYLGISKHFSIVEEGCIAPVYTATLRLDSGAVFWSDGGILY